MTIYKMLMSTYINHVYNSINEIDELKTIVFIIPVIGLQILYKAILFSIVFYKYDSELD